MSEFMPEPALVLETMEEVREAMDADLREVWPYPVRWNVRANWIVALIEEIEGDPKDGRRGFAYNSDVKRLAEQRLGLPSKPEVLYSQESDTLSLLIYNAQKYHRSDDLRRRGFVPGTPELLEQASREGRKIATAGGMALNARRINGQLYAMEPRARNRCRLIDGAAVKLLPKGVRELGEGERDRPWIEVVVSVQGQPEAG